jgi:hypothetical protein
MESWLKCKVSKGMLPGEYVVMTSTSDGRSFSLFAPEKAVRVEDGLVRVDVLQRREEAALVWLPADPLELNSRTVTVPTRDLIAA